MNKQNKKNSKGGLSSEAYPYNMLNYPGVLLY